jgi:ribonuclease G
MRKEIIINSAINEVRVAMTEDGHLAEYFIEQPENEKILGNVYYGKVSKVAQGINAAFIDIGMSQDAFLHFSDVDEMNLYNNFDDTNEDDEVEDTSNIKDEEDTNSPKDSETDAPVTEEIGAITQEFAIFSTKSSGDVIINLQEDKEVLVQVVREPYSHKGMKVTTKIAIPGRYVVMLPFEKMIGISRKIRSDYERRRLRRLAKKSLPKGFGCIIRTASVGKNEEELLNDWENLINTWKAVEQKIEMARRTKTPTLVYQDMLLATSVIRDFFKKDISRVVIDSSKLYNTIIAYLKINDQSFVRKVEYYNGVIPIFEVLGIEKEIRRTNKRTLSLNNGGDIVIDRTEALTVIDVNSGKSTESDQERNSLQTNIEAAREIAKQMRLRDIGGIIVVDFIDMQLDENKRKLFNEMLNAIRYDRAKIVIYPLTQLGLMQITRQRIHQNLIEKTSDACPACHGSGRIASNATLLNSIEKWLKNYTKITNDFKLILMVNPQIAEFLTEGDYSIISRLMIKYFVKITVQQNDSIPIDNFRVMSVRKQKDITNEYV